MTALELQVGDVFETYTIRKTLGRGGMGAVYLAHHPRFDSLVALKVMIIKAASDDEMETHRARFKREARTLMKLRHQSIIRVYDFAEHIEPGDNGDDDICPYILMEYFPGVDGMKWVKQGPTLDRVRHIAIQLADALAAAHAAGILHRDLKHMNILVNDNDQAMLIDFGIAKGDGDETVTQTGLSVGTLSHMAPELLVPHPAHTEATDLYAFGCLLYFLTTHKAAFSGGGGDIGGLFHKILHAPHTPMRTFRPDVSDDWERIVDDLLQKDPAKRITTAAQLLRRLVQANPIDPSAPPYEPRASQSGSVKLVPAQPPTMSVGASAFSGEVFNAAGTSGKAAAATPQSAGVEPTVQSRIKAPSLNSDDPFAGARGEPVSASVPNSMLPPLDGITGIQTNFTLPPASPPAQAPAAVSSVLPATPEAPAAPLSAVGPLPVPARASAAATADPAANEMGTFIASLQPAREPTVHAKPVAVPVELAPPAGEDHVTPHTGGFNVVGSAGATEDRSIVAPLPAFAAATPKAASKESAMKALAMPIAAVLAVVLLGVGVYALFSGGAAPAANKPTAEQVAADEAMKRAEERANREVAAVASAKSASTVSIPQAPPQQFQAQPTPAAGLPGPGTTGGAPGGTAAVSHPKAQQAPRVATSSPPPPEAAAAEPVDPALARYAGRKFNTGAFGGATPAAASASSADAASAPVAGVKVPVRVDAEITSAPSPVIAVVTKETQVGPHLLKVGTQIHGTSSQGTGTRVAVTFKFAIVGGKNVPLSGQALGQDQRAGLPGTRSLGNGTDVAARAIGGAAGALTSAAGELAGDNAAGAALRNGGSTAASKTERLNSDENIVTVKRGARFSVYVGG